MADDAAHFVRDATGIAAADLRDETGAVQVYAARLTDGPDTVRLITTTAEQTAVTDRLDAWASLSSRPGISTVYERGTTPRPWLAVTTAGTPLSEAAPLSVEQTRAVVGDVAEALRAAAAAGHSPATISPASVRVTTDGGTLDWPIQPRDEATTSDDTAVTQLGRLAYYAVTGQLPGADDGQQPLEDAVPPAVAAVIETALSTDADERYDSPYAFKRALLFESHTTPDPPDEGERPARDTEPPTGMGPPSDSGDVEATDDSTAVGRRAVLGAAGLAAVAAAGGAWATATYLQDSKGGRFPQFRFDAANTGHVTASAGPTADVTEAWSVELGADVRTSPVVAEKTVLVSDGDGSVYALATQDGGERWRASLEAFGAVTAALDDGRMYFADSSGNGPAISARSLADGAERWRNETVESPLRTPTVVDERLYAFGNQGVYAFTTDGEREWEAAGLSTTSLAGAVVDDTLYVGALTRETSETTWEEQTRGVVALDTADGSTRWTFDGGSTVGSSPAVADGLVYVGLEEDGLVALDSEEGTVEWRFNTTAPVVSSPAVTDHNGGTVYVGCNDGSVYAVDSKRGGIEWEFDTGAAVISSPAVASDTVYVGSTDGAVYALDTTEGTVRWRFETGNDVISSPAVVSNTVYVGSNDGAIYALTEP
jgi:outer membrane protein assembly factor BamB